MPLILGTNSIKDTGYDVANSVRLQDAYFNRSVTPSSATSWTLSFWIKISGHNGSSEGYLWSCGSSSEAQGFYISASSYLGYYGATGYGSDSTLSQGVLRDPSAWYHICFSVNSGTGTLYINGVQDATMSSVAPLNAHTGNEMTVNTYSGDKAGFDNFLGYMAEYVFIDGTALTPTSFGEFDEDSGIWKPIDVSGLTFGTNGFYLDFENSGSLGADVSGNGNNFTVNNLTSIDQTTDTCTNNFATLNSLNTSTNITMAEGNTKITTSTNGWLGSAGTIGITKGFPCYWEAKATTNTRIYFGLSRLEDYDPVTGTTTEGQSNLDYMWRASSANLVYYRGSSQSVTVSAVSAGDILACSVDSSGNVKFYNNGSAIHTFSTVLVDGYFYFPILSVNGFTSTETMEANFGNPAFSISSGNTDADGYGNFEHAPPANHYALNTKNLAEYG